MGLPEQLLDLASKAHECRRAGHSETEIARAAGIPDRVQAHPNDIVERMLRMPLSEIPAVEFTSMLVTVNRVLAYASDPRECHCPKMEA